MASPSNKDDLTCSLCCTIFTDPVTIFCGHSFCRTCIADAIRDVQRCPLCRSSVTAEVQSLPTTFILQKLAENAKDAPEKIEEPRCKNTEVSEQCPEHEEKLKLFCVTDQRLICVICRDEERHEGHKFKTIKEAAVSMRKELETGVQTLVGDIDSMESKADAQKKEILKTKEKSRKLLNQINQQFGEMHAFLRKREEEIEKELRNKEHDDVEKMRQMLNNVQMALAESKELKKKAASVLAITDSERFLRSWTEGDTTAALKPLFKLRSGDFQVVNTSLCLGPYESHLQFFVWKEMLQIVEPREEVLALRVESGDISLSADGRSLFHATKSTIAESGLLFGQTSASHNFGRNTPRSFGFASSKPHQSSSTFGFGNSLFGSPVYDQQTIPSTQGGFGLFNSPSEEVIAPKGIALSATEFTSGRHYWEIEVGKRDYWELGVKSHFLKHHGQKYAACCPNKVTDLVFGEKTRKIGIFLNCSSGVLSFYDAANMRHIHTMTADLLSGPVSAYFGIGYTADETDRNILTVCWY